MALSISGVSESKANARRAIRSIAVVTVLVVAVVGYILLNMYSPSLPAVAAALKGQSTSEILEASNAKEMGNRLYIPTLNVSVPIETGSDSAVLQTGAWQQTPELGSPLGGGNFVLSALRFEMGLTPVHTIESSPFYNIDTLKNGDELYVDYEGERYGYEVTKTVRDVTGDRADIEVEADEPTLTLYSVNKDGTADNSVVVTARFLGQIES